MENYTEYLRKKENQQLKNFLDSALQTINLGLGNELISLRKTSYKHYDNVLEIKHTSGKVAHININMNSISATARCLFSYISTGQAEGLIKEG
jgi:hypothetical protein